MPLQWKELFEGIYGHRSWFKRRCSLCRPFLSPKLHQILPRHRVLEQSLEALCTAFWQLVQHQTPTIRKEGRRGLMHGS